jgi:hypothetical protein
MMVQNGEAAALCERAAQAGREGNRSGERCSEARGGCSPFIGAGEGWPGQLTLALMALTPLKTGRLDVRLRREIKGGEVKARW